MQVIDLTKRSGAGIVPRYSFLVPSCPSAQNNDSGAVASPKTGFLFKKSSCANPSSAIITVAVAFMFL